MNTCEMNRTLRCVSDVPCRSLDEVEQDGKDYDVSPYYLINHIRWPHKVIPVIEIEPVYGAFLPLKPGLDIAVLRAWLKTNITGGYQLCTRFKWQPMDHGIVREFIGLTITSYNQMDFVLLKMYWIPDDSGYRPHGS